MLNKAHELNAGCGKGDPSGTGDSLFHRGATKGQQYLIASPSIIKTW